MSRIYPRDPADLDGRAIDIARALAMDAVQKANSGHPGTPMALAPVAHLLFQEFLRHDPRDPDWPGRDRFVLSAGHASLLLYVQLYLTGYGLSLEDITLFRQLHSRTPGHPEHGHTPGVETTTGPLGQGFANAVGMAMAARRTRQMWDPEGSGLFDHHILRHLLRRRPGGGRVLGGGQPGRAPAPRRPGLRLRRQPHLHRG